MSGKGTDRMEPRCSVVAVHGISGESGKTQAGFSDELAALVMDDPSWRKKFWREAVWEGECDEFDEEVGKVVSELVNSCSFGSFMQFFRERSATRKGFSDLFADFGQCVSWFANRGMSAFVSWVLDHVLDLPLYLGISYGERMRAVVRKRIRLAARQTGGVVVVGHSLGSVIAYDVVAKLLRKPASHQGTRDHGIAAGMGKRLAKETKGNHPGAGIAEMGEFLQQGGSRSIEKGASPNDVPRH